MAIFFKLIPPYLNLSFLAPYGFSKDNGVGVFEIPFIDRMGIIFIICIIGMYIISMIENSKGLLTNGLEVDSSMFKTSRSFAVGSLIVVGIIVALYSVFW